MKRTPVHLLNVDSLISGRLFLKIGTMILIVMLTVSRLVAQEGRTITGTITDNANVPIPSATIVVTGTTEGTISSIDGTYSIEVPATAISLTFSSVGYVTQTIDLAGKTVIDFTLAPEVTELDEDIVVGYGVQKKTKLTGAVSQLSGNDIVQGKGTSSLELALQGEIPGLTVTRTSSRPGNEGLDLNIHGPISVNEVKPLILLDGVEIPSWELSQINPRDIESVSVLKDAMAAIYGSKAAGGVILLTTKRGEAGSIKVSYSGAYQMNYVNKRVPLASMKEWAQLWLDVGAADAIATSPAYRFFTGETFQQIADGTIPDSIYLASKILRIKDTDQFDAMYGPTPSQRHNLSITGGNDRATFFTSIGYANDRSIIDFVYDGQKKINLRTNVDFKVSDVIKTEFNIAYDSRVVDEPTQGVGEGVDILPIFPLYNPKGQYFDNFSANNVLARLDEGGRTEHTENIFHTGARLIFDFDKYVKGLSVEGSYNLRNRGGENILGTRSVTMYEWEGSVSYIRPDPEMTSIETNEEKNNFQVYHILGHYTRGFNQHTINITAGITSESDKYSWNEMFNFNSIDTTIQTNEDGQYTVGMDSYIARFNYDYKSIFLLELLGRRDELSRLHPDIGWENFGSASAGIVISKMAFMNRLKSLNFLKARVSWGSAGSERVSTTNFGVDWAVLNSRLGGGFDYFTRKNNEMLIALSPAPNSGVLTTRGWDATLTWHGKKGDFSYEIGGWMSDSRSEVTRMEVQTSISRGLNTIIEGKPLNALYVYRTEGGFLRDEADVLDYYDKYGFVDPADQTVMKPGTILPAYQNYNRLLPGCVRRVDLSGPDGVPDGIINTDDLDYYGDANPHYTFGFNLGLKYKNIDFSAFFQGVGQQYLIREGSLASPFRTWWTNLNNTYLNNTWTEDNPDAEFPRISLQGSRKDWNYGHPNDINVMNVAYLRAKNLSLGYTLPGSLLDKVNIDRVRVYASADDAFVISNVKDGFDPEKGINTSQGNSVPFTGALLVGVDVTF